MWLKEVKGHETRDDCSRTGRLNGGMATLSTRATDSVSPHQYPNDIFCRNRKKHPEFHKDFQGTQIAKTILKRKSSCRVHTSFCNLLCKSANSVARCWHRTDSQTCGTARNPGTDPHVSVSWPSGGCLAIQRDGKGFPALRSVLRPPRRESRTPTCRGLRSTVTQHQLAPAQNGSKTTSES